jgi:hypothetical protein
MGIPHDEISILRTMVTPEVDVGGNGIYSQKVEGGMAAMIMG